jgi:hypothetical protein
MENAHASHQEIACECKELFRRDYRSVGGPRKLSTDCSVLGKPEHSKEVYEILIETGAAGRMTGSTASDMAVDSMSQAAHEDEYDPWLG